MKKLLLALALIITGSVFAQQDLTLYNARYLQQSGFTNPAFFHECKVNVGMPLLSGIYVNAGNSGFVYKDFVNQGNGGALTLTPFTAIDKMKDVNYFNQEFRMDVLHFGFTIKDINYVELNVSLREQFAWTYPKDMFTFIFAGNASDDPAYSFLGERASFDGFGVDLNIFTEIGVRYARKFLDDQSLTIGVRPKLLLGGANIYTRTSELGITTDATTYGLTLDGNMELNTSFPIPADSNISSFDPASDLTPGTFLKNMGFGIDIGAKYDITEELEVSASVTDIGFIGWKTNPKSYIIDNKTIEFNGVEGLENAFFDAQDGTSAGDSAGTILEQFSDSLQAKFVPTENTDKYRTWLTSRMNVGVNYQLAEKHNVGLLVNGQLSKRKLRAAMTVSYNFRIRKWLGFHANYSIYNRSFLNVGTGLSFNLWPFQYYIMTDNVLAPIMPYNTKNLHVRTGINWVFGCQNDKDKDGIPDKEDDCPEDPGPVELKGCPDTDKDGVLDKDDKCVETPGLAEFDGCPDRDGDGIIDMEDECPDAPGIAEFKGCPDTDEDGIKDSEDECPTVAGIPEFNGCPDTDKDGIRDANDECPETPGIPEFNGCPDTDSDGIIDSEDDCPEKAGPPQYNGCPDTDGDGLIDSKDGCPEKAGPVDNNGCPYGDRDGDGLIDKEDSCPDTPGPVDNKGCPYSDLDGDGVFDKDDRCPQTPGPADNEGCPVIEEEEQEVLNTAFDNLEFETGKDVIKAASYESLDGLAELLIKKSEWKLQISGHTDSQGKESSNLLLSEKRSKAVAKYLESKGVPQSQMIVQWFGESKPIADNSTAEGRAKNRRVEMEVIFD